MTRWHKTQDCVEFIENSQLDGDGFENEDYDDIREQAIFATADSPLDEGDEIIERLDRIERAVLQKIKEGGKKNGRGKA